VPRRARANFGQRSTPSGYESNGDGAAGGVGAVRRLRLGRTTVVERVEEVDPPRRHVYGVVKGMPVRNYRAEVSITPTAEGSRVHWSASRDRTVAGRLVQRQRRSLCPQVVQSLISPAEARGDVPGVAISQTEARPERFG
jgi:carbon monoxide dehydrogenase subunit G